MVHIVEGGAVEMEEWKNKVGEDEVLQSVIEEMKKGWVEKKLVAEEVKPFWNATDELSLDDEREMCGWGRNMEHWCLELYSILLGFMCGVECYEFS
ncbi:hypothetical protein NDU88_002754 [Pleurodeles waltl]|uniref:Uncharacterized protein n=1 Tax=Pleurodeles waltl TaxID=8319 RepID=A0AAV7UY05_PLEWA|nr:hypothetical protein NDU88_002754 [Pleurodeles waltl]